MILDFHNRVLGNGNVCRSIHLLVDPIYIVLDCGNHIVCSPLSKAGNPNFENLKWGKPKGGKDFHYERGEPNFEVEYRDKKGQKSRLLDVN